MALNSIEKYQMPSRGSVELEINCNGQVSTIKIGSDGVSITTPGFIIIRETETETDLKMKEIDSIFELSRLVKSCCRIQS